MNEIKFTIPGKPFGKQRPRVITARHTRPKKR